MKFILLFALIGISFADQTLYASDLARGLGFATFDHQFNVFKITHNKRYATAEEEERRKLYFLKTLQEIEAHNELYKKGEKTHELGINQFADLTDEEFNARMFRMPDLSTYNYTSQYMEAYTPSADSLSSYPATFDWNAQGKVTRVKNQGGCGSCWSFSTSGTIESQYAVRQNVHVELSEEQMVDCMNTNCGGQFINDALNYVIKTGGLEEEGVYPYSAGSGHTGACRNNPSAKHYKISSYGSLGYGVGQGHPLATDDEIMGAVQDKGPLAMMFNANGNTFRNYKSGVITDNDMGWTGSHAVLVVGWGSEGGHNFWLVKNSWGNTWGLNGFFKILRGGNLRHVNEYLYWPNI